MVIVVMDMIPVVVVTMVVMIFMSFTGGIGSGCDDREEHGCTPSYLF